MNLESPQTLPTLDTGHDNPARATGRLSWPVVWLAMIFLAEFSTVAIQIAHHQSSFDLYMAALCFLVCLLGAGQDAATGHIPNSLTLTAILVGLGAHTLAGILTWLMPQAAGTGLAGPWLIMDAIAGFAFCAALGIVCQFIGQMCGGDMKLLAAAGALLGYHAVWPMLLCALVVALPYALLNLVLFGGLNAMMRTVSLQILALVYLRELPPKEAVSKRYIPLGVPLLLGLLLSRLYPISQWLWS